MSFVSGEGEVGGRVCANGVTGFEGNAHPYKHNILRMDGKTSIADLPEVQTTMQKMAAPPSEPTAR